MGNKPLVSILMNCFNGERYLKEAIESVISQSYKNWELIFWDNLSNDNSIKIASEFNDNRIKIFRSKIHTNLGKARKDAFGKAKGDYLAFLDVDDIWMKHKLKNQIKIFQDKEVGITFTNTIYFSKKRKKFLYKPKSKFLLNTKSLITNYCLSLPSIMLDIKKLNKLDYTFDERYCHISDFDLIIRISSISKSKYLDEVLSGWRIHTNNESFQRRELFSIETDNWCDFHKQNIYLKDYLNEINELKLLTLAQKRILNYNFNLGIFYRSITFKNSNNKNKFFILISFIPFIPKIFYFIKKYIFNLTWY